MKMFKMVLAVMLVLALAGPASAAWTTNLTEGSVEGVPGGTDRSFIMTASVDLSEVPASSATGVFQMVIIPSNTWVDSVVVKGSGSAKWIAATTNFSYTSGTFDVGDGDNQAFFVSNADLSNVTWSANQETLAYVNSGGTASTTSSFTRAITKFYSVDDTIDLRFDHSCSNGIITLKVGGRYLGLK